MSWLGEAFSYFRRLTLLDHEVGRLTEAVETMKDELGDHDSRLVRVETIIDLYRGAPTARPPRLPRR